MQFEDLKAWQKARELTNGIYRISKTAPLKMDFGLRDQLQRAAVSAMTNLAEGFERAGEGEKLQFWNIARASAGEVKSLLYVVGDNQLAEDAAVQKNRALAIEVSALTQGLINSFSKKRGER
ncbi:MAG: four helix bundle protein [Verrucomicrobiia bacterium]|jgi:four helix bundle protein